MQNAAANPKPLSPAEQLGALIRQHRVARDIDLHEVSDRVGVKQYEDRLAELKRTVTSAEKRRADAADQLAKSVQAAVYE